MSVRRHVSLRIMSENVCLFVCTIVCVQDGCVLDLKIWGAGDATEHVEDTVPLRDEIVVGVRG